MINLLPQDAQRAIRMSYLMRLGVVVLFFLICIAVAGLALLAPSYILSRGMLSAAQEHAELVKRSAEFHTQSEAAAALAESRERLTILESTRAATSTHALLGEILAVRGDVRLFGAYMEQGPEAVGMRIAGRAPSRDALLAFVSRVRGISSVSSADLPVSDLTEVKDINFSVTVISTPAQ